MSLDSYNEDKFQVCRPNRVMRVFSIKNNENCLADVPKINPGNQFRVILSENNLRTYLQILKNACEEPF